MPIKVLEPYVAAQIAAGEVVERPASIVKELVENAIDAQASEIRIEIREGGRREIRVVDNGIGIPTDEIETAFQRHATSKLQSAADLFNIHTLGFRGEALPSVAAVAQVVCTSRTADAETGIELRLAGGEIQARVPRGGIPGTTFIVKNLFYNAPVRLKFLRSDASEAAQISAFIAHYALAHPLIRWTLVIDGRLSLQTPGSGQLIDALIELYGIEIARQMLPVDDAAGEGDHMTRVSGLVSQPSLHRSARSSMHLFVNRRWIQARGQIAFVIEEAYHTLLMKGRHPLVVLNIEVDPGAIDVNVHPTKSEIKFLYEQQVFALIGRAVRAALAEHIQIQPLAFARNDTPDETLPRRIELRPPNVMRSSQTGDEQAEPEVYSSSSSIQAAGQEYDGTPHAGSHPSLLRLSSPDERASTVRSHNDAASPEPVPSVHWPKQMPLNAMPEVPPHSTPGMTRLPPLRVVGQVGETYVVADAGDGMYLIDQHAAHERVVYERLMRTAGEQPLERQSLLLPVQPSLPAQALTLLCDHIDDLLQWGFQIVLDGSHMTILSVPAGLVEGEVGPALLEIAEHLNASTGSTPEAWREQILTTVACHSAIRAGQILSHEEMRQLLQQLERCEFPRSCPHGRPTVLLLSQSQLDRQFGRKG
ncbi:MAG: DNA mismatch repair endonuclease MutL [Herpetosiphon sp.]